MVSAARPFAAAGLHDLSRVPDFCLDVSCTLRQAMALLGDTPQGARVLVDGAGELLAVLDFRRLNEAVLALGDLDATLRQAQFPQPPFIRLDDPAEAAGRVFAETREPLLPVCDSSLRVVNVVFREGFYQWLSEDMPWDPCMDFSKLCEKGARQDPVFRPWGSYRVLLRNGFTQAKVLVLRPGQELSLQKHALRDEHWIVVHGEGVFRLDDRFCRVEKGFSVDILRTAVHWLCNTSKTQDLVLVEVQTGDYFGEDDIVRLADRYRRA